LDFIGSRYLTTNVWISKARILSLYTTKPPEKIKGLLVDDYI